MYYAPYEKLKFCFKVNVASGFYVQFNFLHLIFVVKLHTSIPILFSIYREFSKFLPIFQELCTSF